MTASGEDLAAGQCWRFHATHGYDDARLIIGAMVTPSEGERIVCYSVTRAPTKLPDGTIGESMISFIPMAETAFRATIIELDGTAEPPAEFSDELKAWQNDTRGLAVFTVPFDGCLDRLLANQAAALIGRSAGQSAA